MSRLRVNKFDVQVVWPDGGCMRFKSMEKDLNPDDVALKLQAIAYRITFMNKQVKAKGAVK